MADSINCSIEWQKQQIDGSLIPYDADVVGPGASLHLYPYAQRANVMQVLGAFIATALTALFALIFGLATHSIPLDLTNNVDDCVRVLLRSVFIRIRKAFHIPPLSRTEDEDFRHRRIEVLEAFMVSVSDQILISEIAVLVAGFSRRTDLSVYSANVITALALLASSVHLATLPVIKRYNRSNRVVSIAKLVLMLSACTLLVILLVFQASATWYDYAYFKCAVRAFESPSDVLTGIAYYTVSLTTHLCSLRGYQSFHIPTPQRERHDLG